MGIGISSRFGPVRVGSHVSDKELSGCFSVIAGIAFVGLAIFWPYLLGGWVAGKFGAPKGSVARIVTGWLFEAGYVLVAVSICVRSVLARRASTNQVSIRAAEDLLTVAEQAIERLRSDPTGTTDQSLARNERLLLTLDCVDLIEPRVAQRGGPRVPTVVASGQAIVSSKAIHFRSAEKHMTWKVADIDTEYEGSDYLTWGMTNRRTVSGIGGSLLVKEVLQGLTLWASQLPAEPTEAETYFLNLRQRANADLESLTGRGARSLR